MKQFFIHIILCFFFLIPYASAKQHPSKLRLIPVTLQFQWRHQFEYAGFYAAKEQGYYQDAGLDVRFYEYRSEQNLIDDVASGKRTFGIGPARVIIERLQGKQIRLLANYFKRSPLVIVAKPHIASPEDLFHKRVMMSEKDLNNSNIIHMLSFAGLTPEDLQIVPHTFNIDTFIQGQVDAATIFLTNEAFDLEKSGLTFNIINPNIYGGLSFDGNLFTAESTAVENPIMVERFRQASNKGWEYALAHPDEMVTLIIDKYNSQDKAKNQLMFEAREISRMMLPDIYPVGSLSPGRAWYGTTLPWGTNKHITFTDEEKDYLRSHPVIRVSNETGWHPFDFSINNTPHGYSVDLLHILEQRLGVRFEFVTGHNCKALMEKFNKQEIDLIQSAVKTPETQVYTRFTDHYLSYRNGFVVSEETPDIESIEQLLNKTIAVPQGSAQQIFLETNYPGIKLIQTRTNEGAFNIVMKGAADAAIENKLTMRYLQGKKKVAGLKNTGWFREMDNNKAVTLHLGVHKNNKILHTILNKALRHIIPGEILALDKKWFGQLSSPAAPDIGLTLEEHRYLNENPVATIAVLKGYVPFSFEEHWEVKGIVNDILGLLSEKTGISFKKKLGQWSHNLSCFKNKEVDIISDISHRKEWEAFTLFTTPYFEVPTVVFVRDDFGSYEGIESLRGKRVGLLKDVYYEDLLSEYENIEVVHFGSYGKMTKALSYGDIDALIQNLTVISYYARKYTLSNIEVAGELDIDRFSLEDLRLGIRPDNPLLHSILQKGLNSIDINERNQIINRWTGFSYNLEVFSPKENKLDLTVRERAYLKNKGVIKMSVLPDWLPYERIDETGSHVGIGAELIKIIEKNIGIPIELIPTNDWGASLQNLRERRCDILPIAMNVPSRQDDMTFTRPYIVEPFVIATRSREFFIKDARDIGNRKIGIIKDYAFTELLKQRYPDLQIINVENAKEGLEQVRSEELFGYIDSMPTIGYALQEHAMLDLKIAGKLEFDLELTIASRNDEPLLASIMQKATDAITEEERREIIGKWLSIKFEKGFDYQLFWRFLAGGMIIVLGFVFWNRKLISEIQKRKDAESHLKYARQEALAASKAKGDFLANMSHEIRTPMNAIIGMSSLALNKDYPEDALGYFKNIHTSGQSLLAIINDVLDFSKIEAGKIEIETIPFSLRELLEQIAVIFEPLTAQKRIRLIFNVDEAIDEHLMGDPTRIKQILTNFTSNAVKFTEKGCVTIEAEVIQADDASQQIRISVIDTGKGIHDKYQEKLFEAFIQEDVSTTRTYGGTGLGLTISKVLTELMGGTIGMESKPGMGSTFHITLNLATTNELHIDGETMVTSHIHNARVLIVDDDPQARALLKETMKGFSFTLDEASGPGEAIWKLEISTEPYDLMLLDWKMPQQNGTDFYNALKRRKRNFTIPKAIIISAYDNSDMLSEARKAGIVSIFRKPVKPSELLVGIVNALGKQVLIKHPRKRHTEFNRIKFKHQTILLVEDNELNQDVCREILEAVHLKVIIANNGQEAVTQFTERHENIALVLMDLQMPVMDGYGAAREIRSLPNGTKVPIIALSADAVTGTREKVLACGMNDYETKPIVPQQLIGTLSKFLLHKTVMPGRGESGADNGQMDAAKAEDVFPDIPGLDIAQGISNRLENVENYKKALLKFAGNYKNHISECQTAFLKSDFKTLAEQLHMLKGVSGNIQATDIHRLTARIEIMAKEHSPECEEELEKLHKQVGTLCARIEHRLASASHGPEEKNRPAISDEAMAHALVDIIPLLEESDTRARKRLEQLLDQQLPKSARKDIESAVGAMNGYDFDGALFHIKAIHERLNND